MKKLLAVLFLLSLAAATNAKADSLITGSVFNRDLSGNTCSDSGSSSSGLSLSCGTPSGSFNTNGNVSLVANIGDTSGYADEEAQSGSDNHDTELTYETESYDLSVTGMYMLTGGTGYGYVDLSTSLSKGTLGSFPQCTLTFDGQSLDCSVGGDLIAYVPYNTPLSLDLSVTSGGDAEYNDGYHIFFGYDFSALTPITPTPEPTSLLLIGTGLLPLVQRLRRRG